MERLKDRVAIVTGAGQGIGRAYAKALAAAGAAVAVCDLNDCATTVREIEAARGRAIGGIVDVCDARAVAAFVERTASELGSVDILVNNAAIFAALSLKPFTEISSEEWDKVLTVNVRGSFECAKAVVPKMRAKGYGKIINVASGTVFKGSPMVTHYVASKGAIIAFTRCIARELGPDGIRVNAIAPGLILSEGVKANPDYDQAAVGSNTATRALKRDAVPEDLLGTIVFLASADSDFITGQTIVVDGGSVMH
jgi:NAD(P)-dependent dehydrogenase (short-subunit alcohol dehydrogenase family)